MLRILTSTALVSLLAVPAVAQDITYAGAGLSFDSWSNDTDDADKTFLNGAVELSVDQFLLGAELSNQSFDSGDFTIQYLSGYAAYEVMPGLLVGGGLTSVTLEEGISSDFSGYELFGQYETGPFGAGLTYAVPNSDFEDSTVTSFYGQGELSPGLTATAMFEQYEDFDENTYAFAIDYDNGPIGLRAFSQGVTDDIFSALGARASYDVTNQIAVTGQFATADLFGGEATSYAIGGSYALADGFLVDASIGMAELDGEEVTTVQFGISYEMGDRKRLDRAIRTDFANDRNDALGPFAIDIGIGSGIVLFGS